MHKARNGVMQAYVLFSLLNILPIKDRKHISLAPDHSEMGEILIQKFRN